MDSPNSIPEVDLRRTAWENKSRFVHVRNHVRNKSDPAANAEANGMTWRSGLRRLSGAIAVEMLYRSGLCVLSRRCHKDSVLVLMYHDILPPGFPDRNVLFGMTVNTEEFGWQLDHIKAHYNPISLKQLCAWLAGQGALPPRSVLVTFDDGHTNNLHYALPALQKRGMLAVCFIVAGNLGERHLIWVEEGYSRLMSSNAEMWVSLDGQRHVLKSFHDRAAACSYFFRLLQKLPEEDQQKEMTNLRRQFPVEEDGGRFRTRFEFLSHAQLRSLNGSNIEIGAHSMTHPVLATLRVERARAEIVGSKLRLEGATGAAINAFAYPFGQPGADFGDRDKDLIREAGYKVAFSGMPGFVNRDSDVFCLPRIAVGRMSRARFVATITGALETLKQFVGRQ